MRRLLAIGCCGLGLTVPAAAQADGGAVPPLLGGAGVTAPGSDFNYVTLADGRGTLLERVRRAGGAVEGSARLPRRVAVPGATWDGQGTGLSADGRTLVLTDALGPYPRRTRLAVVDARRLRVRAQIALRGYFAVDAVSPTGRWLYLTHYRSPNNFLDYEVRAYDLRARRLLPQPIVDPREPDEKMLGLPMTRTTSPDGRRVYTLYQHPGGEPFIHALDTSGRTAACIDLPQLQGQESFDGARLRLTGPRLTVTTPDGPQAVVDTRTFAVRKPAAPVHRRAAAAPHDGGGPPWALALLAAPVLLAALALFARRRRRPPQAAAASPSASKSSA
jgi:hypothetical protein